MYRLLRQVIINIACSCKIHRQTKPTCAVWELFNKRKKFKLKFANFVINGWYIDRKSSHRYYRVIIILSEVFSCGFMRCFWRFRLPKCLSSPLIIRYSDLNICKTLYFSLTKFSYKSSSQYLECKIFERAFIEIFCVRNWQLQIYLLLPTEYSD